MIGIMYIGQKRYVEMSENNHKKLISELEKIAPITIYNFTRDLDQPSGSPWPQGGAIQVFEFLEGIEKVNEDIVIKLRTDLWFTTSSIIALVEEVKLVYEKKQDASFMGCNWKDYIGHTYTKDHMDLHAMPQDFVVIVNKNILRTKKEIYKSINDINAASPKKLEHGNKPFGAIVKDTQRTYNIFVQIYLIRKHLDEPFDPWQVGYDYIAAEVRRVGHKMPDAMPWYLTTKKEKLVIYLLPYQSESFFHSEWFQQIVDDNFIIEHYTDDKTYDKDTVFVMGARQYLLEEHREKFNDKRLIVDVMWESYSGKYGKLHVKLKNPNHFYIYGSYHAEPVEGTAFVPNFLWYNESLWWRQYGLHEYQPQKTYDKKFLCLVGHARSWRLDFLEAAAPWLESDALYSCTQNGLVLPMDDPIPGLVWHRQSNPNWYDSTCFSIVLETARSWDWAAVFLTEKIYKPIGFQHPFMVLGKTGILTYLKSQGFVTYDNLFDESYDDESDLQKKISLILDNVSNYEKCPYDNETLKRIEHNHSLFYNQQRIYHGLKTELIDPIKNFIGTQ